jgi:DNA-binding HxlR family transcriptional regulator
MSPRIPITDKKRLPRTKRVAKPPRFNLTPRDVELVRAVFKYRFLGTRQFWWLFPNDSQKNLTNRLRHLFQHGYVNRITLPVSSSRDALIYAMTEQGATLLAESDGVERSEVKWARHLNVVQPTHIQHLLAINDVLISLRHTLELAKAAGTLADYRVYRGDPQKHRLTVQVRDLDGHRSNASVIPDAILVLQAPMGERGVFFLEIDRATMTTVRWQEKVVVYREYSQSSQLAKVWRAEWSILLTVTTSEKRLMSIAEKTVALGGRRGFWFTTSGEITPDTALAPVWVRGTDLFQLRNEKLSKLSDVKLAKRLSVLDALRFDNG